jgi:hypothetical protein
MPAWNITWSFDSVTLPGTSNRRQIVGDRDGLARHCRLVVTSVLPEIWLSHPDVGDDEEHREEHHQRDEEDDPGRRQSL